MKVSTYDIIRRSALASLKLQREDGSFPQGHNGPWNDQDTPARVTAHWTIAILHAYARTGDKELKQAAENAGSYLLSREARPHGYSFYCRDGKNRCNGLIGQAWALEALIHLSEKLKKRDYIETAKNVVSKHEFNAKHSLWHNLEVDGRKLNVNHTLNQQVWFGLMAHRLGDPNAKKFFTGLYRKVVFSDYLRHLTRPFPWFIAAKQSIGYLSFLLTGFVQAMDLLGSQMKDMIRNSVVMLNKLLRKKNRYMWSYNPTGFEAAFVNHKLNIKRDMCSKLITAQLMHHYDFRSGLMKDNTDDRNTLMSRIYELTYLPEIEVEIE